ncbi:MAG: type II toxin-antitoxin system VapC family toxin, partial [Terracidiphilus sp.]
MPDIVLDASAVLAAVYGEAGAQKVRGLFADPESTVLISALNWSEALDRLLRDGMRDDDAQSILAGLNLEIVDFTIEQARIAARLRLIAPQLSLADRACLALASTRNGIAWTTDKIWTRT